MCIFPLFGDANFQRRSSSNISTPTLRIRKSVALSSHQASKQISLVQAAASSTLAGVSGRCQFVSIGARAYQCTLPVCRVFSKNPTAVVGVPDFFPLSIPMSLPDPIKADKRFRIRPHASPFHLEFPSHPDPTSDSAAPRTATSALGRSNHSRSRSFSSPSMLGSPRQGWSCT